MIDNKSIENNTLKSYSWNEKNFIIKTEIKKLTTIKHLLNTDVFITRNQGGAKERKNITNKLIVLLEGIINLVKSL